MSFQDVAKAVRAKAIEHGIHLSMSRLNDAIALACYGKKYASVVAAEKAGKLGPIPFLPPHTAAVARQYRMDEYAFGVSLRDGIVGGPGVSHQGTVDVVMGWLLSQHKKELIRLEHEELTGLVNPALTDRVLSDPRFRAMAVMGFAEWVIAEGEMMVGGRLQKVSELLTQSKSHPAWPARQRAYIVALAATPLRLYVVESVAAGYHLTLRPVDGSRGDRLVQVTERSGSQPDLVGTLIAARVITRHEHLELAGGIYTFNLRPSAQIEFVARVRSAGDPASASRTIRVAWFEQFDQPRPEIRLAGTGESLRLITDTYRCASLETLAARLASDAQVEGNVEFGWSLLVKHEDRRVRPVCSIHHNEDAPGRVTVFYQSEGRAKQYRPWFEGLAADAVAFVDRESVDPYEAAMDPSLSTARRKEPTISADTKTKLIASMYLEQYADFADQPLPLFDGATPRQMLKQPGGEVRVRDLLAIFESNELRLAQNDRRESVSFDFLYQKLGLTHIQETIVTHGTGMHPDQFEVNEAWIVFKMFDEPLPVKNLGECEGIGLMDAGSTCVLNFQILPVGSDFSEIEARGFFQKLKVPVPLRPPRRIFISSDVLTERLKIEAGRLGAAVSSVDAQDLEGIVGRIKESMGDHFDTFLAVGD